ncbi:MAG TPA: hypothetical protein VIL09_07560 [Microvirga sp.]
MAFSKYLASPAHWAGSVTRLLEDEDRRVAVLKALLAACLVQAAYFAVIGLDQIVFVIWGNRQAQTAISAAAIAAGGPWLAYETPILGAPWSLPFEFPTYQLIVAGVHRLGVPLEAAGRAVSFVFHLATLAPLLWLVRTLALGRETALMVAILFLASPLYLYWGRAVMIESTALFFSVSWLALLAAFLREPRALLLAGAVAAGCLATLTKATTWPPFALLGFGLAAMRAWQWFRAGEIRSRLWVLAGCAALALLPLAAAYEWTAFTDRVKALNPFAARLTSDALTRWNFGTLEQRTSLTFWRDIIGGRALFDLFGYALPLAGLALLGALARRRYAALTGACLVAYISAPLVFTNLHVIHSYYQAANGVLGLAAVGLALAALAEAGRARTALGLLVAIVIGQAAYFQVHYAREIQLDARFGAVYRAAQAARAHTQPSDAILVLGQDWSSEALYYAGRRGLTLIAWTPRALMRQSLAANAPAFGGARLGGVIQCNAFAYGRLQPLVDAFVARLPVIADFGDCRFLGPPPSGAAPTAP